MIDAHCHLEQEEIYDRLEELIPKWKKELRHIISSCAHPQDIDKTLEIYEKYHPFVKICIGLHPEFIKELREEEIEHVLKFIHKHASKISAIGEIGLDYHWIKEPEWREKQKELFIRLIKLARELNLPLVIHSWDSTEDAIAILEQQGMKGKKVLMHLLQDKDSVQKIIENGWYASIGPSIAKSKTIKKIARDMPLNRIMLETDSPWFKQEGQEFGEPINVKVACEKIAEIKKLSLQEVEKQTDENAGEFFGLKMIIKTKPNCSLILDNGKGEVLLQLRDKKETIRYPNCLGTFGGDIEPGETPEQAIVRELREELNYDLKNPEYLGNFPFNGYAIHVFRKVDQHINQDIKVNEGQKAMLVSFNQIKGLKFAFNCKEIIEFYFRKYYPK